MSDGINFGNFASRGLDVLKTVGTKVIETIKKPTKNSIAGKAAELVESIRENGLQATAEDIVDDIKNIPSLAEIAENAGLPVPATKVGKSFAETIKGFFTKK